MADKTVEGGALVTAPPEQEQAGELAADKNGATPPLEIELSLDNLLIGDLESFQATGSKQLPMKDMLDLLDKMIVGEHDIRELPVTMFSQILKQFTEITKDIANPGN